MMRRWMRPLPLTILVIAVLLAVKLDRLVQASGGASAALGSAGRAVVPAAQAAGTPEPKRATPPPPATTPAVAPAPPPAPVEPAIGEAERDRKSVV